MNRLEVVAYAQSFVSFLLKSEIEEADIKEIILFGSVARGEFDKKSDIDIFIDIADEKNANKIQKIVGKKAGLFCKSKAAEVWLQKGIKNEISCKVGVLKKWKLERSIISDGITLYGKYKQLPKELKQHCFFSFEPISDITKRNRVVRELFGRKEKGFESEGLIKKINGKTISARGFIVPAQCSGDIIKLFGREKISYKLYDIWNDSF